MFDPRWPALWWRAISASVALASAGDMLQNATHRSGVALGDTEHAGQALSNQRRNPGHRGGHVVEGVGDERERVASGLISQVAGGGRTATQALSALYRIYRQPVLGFLLRKGLPLAAAEDVLQDVFIKIGHSAAQCRHQGLASAWLWRIVANAAADFYRGRSHEVELDDETQESLEAKVPNPEPGASAAAIGDCVSRALQRFAREHPERADALRLMHIEGWSGNQVAAYIGRTPGAAREFLSQCRRVFQAFVAPCRELLSS